jgi:hypothetical protein
MQIVNSGDWLWSKRKDHVAFPQSRLLRRTAVFDSCDHYAGFFWKIVKPNNSSV